MSLECASSEDPLDLLLADDNLELLLSTTDIEMAPADEDEKPSSPVVKTESFPIEMEIAEPTCVPAIGGAVTEWPASAASEPELSMAAVVLLRRRWQRQRRERAGGASKRIDWTHVHPALQELSAGAAGSSRPGSSATPRSHCRCPWRCRWRQRPSSSRMQPSRRRSPDRTP